MLTCMRTTLIIEDSLLRQAKRQAAERDLTVSEVVNDALRESFRVEVRADATPPFAMVTYGRTDQPVHHEPVEFATTLEQDDLKGLAR